MVVVGVVVVFVGKKSKHYSFGIRASRDEKPRKEHTEREREREERRERDSSNLA